MKESLGDIIKKQMGIVGIKNNAELARRIKRSAAYVGDLINDSGKTQSGTYKPSAATLTALAQALQISEAKILSAIGYQTGEVQKKPVNGLEFFEILTDLGLGLSSDIKIPGLEKLNEDDLKEALEIMAAVLMAKAKRKL